MKKLLAILVFLASTSASFAACDQTISPDANVATAVAAAAAGTTVCLNNGNYGSVVLNGVSKSDRVTVQSSSGRGGVISFKMNNSSNITLQSLTINGLDMWNGANKNISVLNNTFTGQLLVTGSGRASASAGILIDGNTFDGINVCASCYEGRLQIYDGGGINVSNNHFGNRGESDGIQMGGYGGMIGPGNVFSDILYSGGRHVDAMQLYGEVDSISIVGNYFFNGGSYIMAPDGSIGGPTVIKENVFVVGDYWNAVQLGGFKGITFEHNTAIGIGVYFNNKTQATNVVARNNIMRGSQFYGTGAISFNMFSASTNASGSSNIIASPAFVGDGNPTSYAGFQLSSSSPGYRAASDGTNMGITSARPVAPTNLTVR